ncbi:MAG: Transcriptional regulator, DeoR family [Firmicutes bacterium]|nr:Transcriptional regulator, DeoR family [Bacillota bacterium]
MLKLDRLISILVVLLRKERVQAKELAEMFGVSVRTILRDVDAINLAGIPIVTYQGVNGGIGIAEGYRLDRSVLTSDEMAAIIAMLKGVAGSIPGSRHEVLLEKLKNIMSKPQLDTLKSKTDRLVIDFSPWGGNEHLKDKIAVINKAIETLKVVEFEYTDSNGLRTNRKVEPYSLILKGQKWYLYAWCLMRQDFRLFKLSRIKELTVLEVCYDPRDVSLEELPWDNEWQKPENVVELELAFEKEMEGIAEEWFGEDLVRLEDGRVMVRAMLPENNWLYGFLLSFGMGVEVISPPHIRTILAEIGAGIHKKYSQET